MESLIPSTARARARNPRGATAQGPEHDTGPAFAEELEGPDERGVGADAGFIGAGRRLPVGRAEGVTIHPSG